MKNRNSKTLELFKLSILFILCIEQFEALCIILFEKFEDEISFLFQFIYIISVYLMKCL